MAPTPDQNRRTAMAFCDLVFNRCQTRLAVERCVGAANTRHTPHAADGKPVFIECLERIAREDPGKPVLFKRSVAEGDLVVLHCHQVWPADANQDWAGIDNVRLGNAAGTARRHPTQ